MAMSLIDFLTEATDVDQLLQQLPQFLASLSIEELRLLDGKLREVGQGQNRPADASPVKTDSWYSQRKQQAASREMTGTQ